MKITRSRFIVFLALLHALFNFSIYAQSRTAFSLIEQNEKETVFLMMREQVDNVFIHIGVGHGHPPVEIEKEDFRSLKMALLDIDLSDFETILPPDAKKNYIIVIRNDYGHEADTSTTYSIPKDSPPNEIKDWIRRLKELAERI
ncbi:hypothetical protein MLD52_21965 [Puniceicoccaceae bacterium K14]|nr:hypothetical protein [Puniceicoccaceae bacterium K14]